MAPFLPIQAASRSQAIRIGGKTIKVGVTSWIDMDPQARGLNNVAPVIELKQHLALGAVVVVGPLSSKPEPEPGGKFSSTTELEEETSATENLGVVAVTLELKHTAVIAVYSQFEARTSVAEGHVKSSLKLNGEPTESQGGNELGEAFRSFTVLPNGITSGAPLQPVTFRLAPGNWTFELHLANETPASTIFAKAGSYIELREV